MKNRLERKIKKTARTAIQICIFDFETLIYGYVFFIIRLIPTIIAVEILGENPKEDRRSFICQGTVLLRHCAPPLSN